MKRISNFMLPEHTNNLYKSEASSSIALTKDVAAKINELVDAYNTFSDDDLKWKQTQEGIIRKGVLFMKDNLINSLYDLLKIYDKDSIKSAMLEAYGEELNLLRVFVTPQMFGAIGDGKNDETSYIQDAIDEANKKGRILFVPRGVYKISRPLVLNGCSLVGEPGNVYHTSGTVFECTSKDFTAIQQGSTNTKDIMFNMSDIIVKGADVGFEIVYSINSKFERLYTAECNLGFKLGSPDSVGLMFCEFNNLYTDKCNKGIEVHSSQYFNNNRFNNGFIQGTNIAMSMTVVGGTGAVDNVFNNVEFKSSEGRGIELSNALNTMFNHCYFECGGNVLRTTSFSSVKLNDCVYGTFKTNNKNGDTNVIYSVGGSVFIINGGTIFLNSNYSNIYFFSAGNEATYQNVIVEKSIIKNGSASGFNFFDREVKTTAYKGEEQVTLTGTVTIDNGASIDVPFTYETPFSSIPNVVLYTMRGGSGVGIHTIVSERTKEGGKLRVTNSSTTPISVSFSIYAKIL